MTPDDGRFVVRMTEEGLFVVKGLEEGLVVAKRLAEGLFVTTMTDEPAVILLVGRMEVELNLTELGAVLPAGLEED